MKKGEHHTDETKARIRAKATGRKRSPASRKKQAETMTGTKRPDISQRMVGNKYGTALKGKKQSPELIAKRAAANVGKRRSEATRKKMRENRSQEARQRAREWCIVLNSQGPRETGIERTVRELLEIFKEPFVQYRPFRGIGVVDFYCERKNLAIEADGEHWHSSPSAIAKDARKDAELGKLGIKVLCLRERDILRDLAKVVLSIQQALNG